MAQTARAHWEGDLKTGKGTIALGSGAFEGAYSFKTRFEGASEPRLAAFALIVTGEPCPASLPAFPGSGEMLFSANAARASRARRIFSAMERRTEAELRW